jgi:hypothetical protein
LLLFDAKNPRLNLSGAQIRLRALTKDSETAGSETERTPLVQQEQ